MTTYTTPMGLGLVILWIPAGGYDGVMCSCALFTWATNYKKIRSDGTAFLNKRYPSR